jgi:hypothetical protein
MGTETELPTLSLMSPTFGIVTTTDSTMDEDLSDPVLPFYEEPYVQILFSTYDWLKECRGDIGESLDASSAAHRIDVDHDYLDQSTDTQSCI